MPFKKRLVKISELVIRIIREFREGSQVSTLNSQGQLKSLSQICFLDIIRDAEILGLKSQNPGIPRVIPKLGYSQDKSLTQTRLCKC